MKDILLTKEALEKIKNELRQLKEKRQKTIERLKVAKDFGDLSENAEYHDARDEQSFTEGKIQELETILKNAKIVEKGNGNNVIGLGSIVETKNQEGKTIFEIVSINESDPKTNRVSDQSPIGRALLGKKIGEKAIVESPAGKKIYQIISIK